MDAVLCALEETFGDAFYCYMSTFIRWDTTDPAAMRPEELAKARLRYAAKAKALAALRSKKAANKPYSERRLRRLEMFESRMELYAPGVRTDD